jgi:mono/diheme cytochrome c family protein
MKILDNLPKLIVLATFAAGIGLAISKMVEPSPVGSAVKVNVPQLSQLAQVGEKAFAANCAKCHGTNAAGTDHGPPFIHDIYNPGHHADIAFFYAARYGVRQHHWPYGDMPPQTQVSQDDVRAIVQYVRELQLANGITFRPHTM